jgi:ABC-2 type transport system ATP-binding protein
MAYVEAKDLKKTYRSGGSVITALDGLSLELERGKILGLLGPNGAGKTTAVKVFTTLLKPDSGFATIDGVDVCQHPDQIRRMIGVSGQYAAVDENLTAIENLWMIGKLYHLTSRAAKARAVELVELFDLTESSNRVVKGFSGGMRRRIDLAGALVGNPDILFLDEPTTGLDPRSRLGLWAIIGNLVSEGTTVFLTTQYLEEADQLADHIAVVDRGRVIARGTSDELKQQVGGQRIEVTVQDVSDVDRATELLRRRGTGEVVSGSDLRHLAIAVDNAPQALQAMMKDFADAGIDLQDAGMRRPTLDDVFLQLTGDAAGSSEEQEA